MTLRNVRSLVGSVRRRLARRSLKPQLNQIRTWVRQGRTDAWIAHQLEVSVSDIRSFKREHELVPDDAAADGDEGLAPGADELDLRAEDDALVAAALEAEQGTDEDEDEDDEDSDDDEDKPKRPARARGRGRARKKAAGPLEGTFDHGEEGYGLWLDPAVEDDPIYAEHWAGHRPVEVTIEEDQIVIRRTGGDEDSSDDSSD